MVIHLLIYIYYKQCWDYIKKKKKSSRLDKGNHNKFYLNRDKDLYLEKYQINLILIIYRVVSKNLLCVHKIPFCMPVVIFSYK